MAIRTIVNCLQRKRLSTGGATISEAQMTRNYRRKLSAMTGLSIALVCLGAISGDGSGDIFVAFSTAGPDSISEDSVSMVEMFPNNGLTRVFAATVQATEEAIVNAMVAAEIVVGVDGLRVEAIPHDQLRTVFQNQ
ncbi:MAG: P1 family peptidase [Woeseiaceae bacterium]